MAYAKRAMRPQMISTTKSSSSPKITPAILPSVSSQAGGAAPAEPAAWAAWARLAIAIELPLCRELALDLLAALLAAVGALVGLASAEHHGCDLSSAGEQTG